MPIMMHGQPLTNGIIASSLHRFRDHERNITPVKTWPLKEFRKTFNTGDRKFTDFLMIFGKHLQFSSISKTAALKSKLLNSRFSRQHMNQIYYVEDNPIFKTNLGIVDGYRTPRVIFTNIQLYSVNESMFATHNYFKIKQLN
jgi:hypothetical protein